MPKWLFLLAGLVWACSGTAPPVDGGLVDAGPSPDSGLGDDSGSADSGASDSGQPDGGPVLACNVLLHFTTDAVRDAGSAAGARVLGLTSPTETLVLGPGQTLSEDVYLFNQSTFEVVGGDGGLTQLGGAIYAMDQSTFRIQGANVAVLQTAVDAFGFYAGDRASIEISDSGISLGNELSNLQLELGCGNATISIVNDDLTVRASSSISAFADDQAHFILEGNRGLVEMTVDDGAHVDVRDTIDPRGIVGMYFTVRQPAPTTLVLPSGPADGGTLDIQLPPAPDGLFPSATVQNSNVLYGVWVEPGTDLTLSDSQAALFLNFHGDGTASNLAPTPPGSFQTKTYALGDRTLALANSSAQVINVYQNASVTPGTLTLDSVQIGEHTCTGVAGTQCVVTNSVIDGSGGFLSAHDGAQLTVASSVVNTYLSAGESAVVRLQRGLMAPGPAHPEIWISTVGDSQVYLEDEFLGLADGGGMPSFETAGQGTVSQLTLDLSFTPTVTRPVSLDIYGTVAVYGDAGTQTWALASTENGVTVPLGSGSPPTSGTKLGTFVSAGLDAGVYPLALSLESDGGTVSNVQRSLQVQ